MNVAFHPKSANASDSMGEAYLKNGDRTLAISSYRQSLRLNPGNNNAVKVLQELGAQ